MTNTINIQKCDNELIVLAYNAALGGRGASFELCRIQSGYGNAVNVSLNLYEEAYTGPINLNSTYGAVSANMWVPLPQGTYSLQFIGINWASASEFAVEVNGNSYTYPTNPNAPAGVVWSPIVSITV